MTDQIRKIGVQERRYADEVKANAISLDNLCEAAAFAFFHDLDLLAVLLDMTNHYPHLWHVTSERTHRMRRARLGDYGPSCALTLTPGES